VKLDQSSALFKRALELTPGGVHSPVRAFGHVDGPPLFIESADGARIRDVDGHSYTDYCMAFGPLILGHRHPAVEQAAIEALRNGWSYGTAERHSLELAELISAQLPASGQMRFVNSGTEAVMAAVRLARAATNRPKILKFTGCYHGHADSMLIEAGSGMAGVPTSAGITQGVAADTLVAPLDDTEALQQIFALHPTQIAAAIIEPLPANHGLLPQRTEFLEMLAQLCSSHGALLIFDEVITGFRLGFGGLTEQTGINPDIVTWGKVLGGGFPVGAFSGRADLMQLVAPVGDVYQAGTLSANPLAMRAGKAALKQALDTGVYTKLEQLGERLENGIKRLDGLNIQRVGSIFWLRNTDHDAQTVRSTAGYETARLNDFAELFRHLLQNKIYFPPSPYEVCFLSAAHSEADIDKLIDACKSYLTKR
jgi:glutamate-1-semialdehyde 2,1-aminomutase